ncbi:MULTISPECIES: AbrB/MazE/SpoVT family DNA-binding domain-containing protein [unclassified Providencia]|uniref:AbrB/MazE/SpoVT family DNA-binding domain-containing protein n=1 Tax=unclassified Providencia TaxID=2633465 RepID=UPI000E826759|nr:antitoxin [Providencia sp.]MBP6081426.1 antitoxin [Providencia sp.]HBO24944.1 antitoxin [Providencia sp.]
MSTTRLRQQGGAVVLTIPSDVANMAGWVVGMKLDIDAFGESVCIKPTKRVARGRKSLSELLSGIDENEIKALNSQLDNSDPIGHEII